jgi:hypothetical protein
LLSEEVGCFNYDGDLRSGRCDDQIWVLGVLENVASLGGLLDRRAFKLRTASCSKDKDSQSASTAIYTPRKQTHRFCRDRAMMLGQ